MNLRSKRGLIGSRDFFVFPGGVPPGVIFSDPGRFHSGLVHEGSPAPSFFRDVSFSADEAMMLLSRDSFELSLFSGFI